MNWSICYRGYQDENKDEKQDENHGKKQDENRTKSKEALFDKLSLQECRNKYMQEKMNTLLEYDERILIKYPLETLEKLSFIPGSRLNILTDEEIGCILKAIDENIEHSKIISYINICKRIQYKTTIKSLVMENMEFCDFFDKYYEKYNKLPSNSEIEDLFKYTRKNSTKKMMLDLHMGDEYYSKLRDSYFDLRIEETAQSGLKDSMSYYITQKYFNIDYSDIERIIKDKKQSMFSNETQKIIKYITKIKNIENITDLIRINKEIGKRNIGMDLGAVYDELYNYYAKEKVEGCFNPKDFKGKKKTILFEGKKVQILMLQGEDFKGIIHTTGIRTNSNGNIEYDNPNTYEVEKDDPMKFATLRGPSDYLSLSTERDDAMAFFDDTKVAIWFGFSNIKPENILRYSPSDGGTPVNNGYYDKVIKNVKEEVSYEREGGMAYDEIQASRYDDMDNIEEVKDYEKRILPNYLLILKGSDNMPHLNYDNIEDKYTRRILRYAVAYHIPIVEMDGEKYLEKFQKKYDNVLEKLKSGKEKFEMKDFMDMSRYRRSIEFYKKVGVADDITIPKVFVEIMGDLNITKENREAVKQFIEMYNDGRLQDAINRLPEEEMREQAKEKLEFLREELQIGNKDKEKELNEDEQSL